MSYDRVIPRDLFNEAKLLKCLAQLVLLIHDGRDKDGKPTPSTLTASHNKEMSERFLIELEPQLNGLYSPNMTILNNGERLTLYTNYNDKGIYPLLMFTDEYEEIEVFHDDGTLTDEFREQLDTP